jgi:hypothetical protein
MSCVLKWSVNQISSRYIVYSHTHIHDNIIFTDLSTLIILNEEHKSLSASVCNFLPPANLCLLDPNNQLSALFWTLSFRSTRVSEEVSLSYQEQVNYMHVCMFDQWIRLLLDRFLLNFVRKLCVYRLFINYTFNEAPVSYCHCAQNSSA